MNKIFFLILVFSLTAFAQEIKIAVISEPQIDDAKSQNLFSETVRNLNQNDQIDFTVVLGNLSKSGNSKQLESAQNILDSLESRKFVLLGVQDVKWNEFATRKFLDFSKEENFFFQKDEIIVLGLNSLIDWRGGGGHFSNETLSWIEEKLENSDSNSTIVLFSFYPFDNSIDNFNEVLNLLNGKKSILISANNYSLKSESTIKQFQLIPLSNSANWNYNLVKIKNDTLTISNINQKDPQKISTSEIPKINFEEADSISQKFSNVNILTEINLEKTLSAPLYFYQNKIFACTKDGTIYCFDENGKKIWESFVYGTILNQPVGADNTLIVSTIEGDITTFNISSGEIIQTLGIGENITSQFLIFDFKGDKSVIIDNDNKNTSILFGTSTGKLFCYDLSSLGILWQSENSKSMIISQPHFYRDKIYFENVEGNVFCIDARSGVLNWKWNEIQDVKLSPASFNFIQNSENIFISHPNKTIYAIDILLGRTNWKTDKFSAGESITLSNDSSKIFVKSQSDKVFIVSAKDGKLINEINLRSGFDTMPIKIVENDSVIFVGSKSGDVFKIFENSGSTILNLGTARINSIIKLNDENFAVSNMDGKIVIFNMNEN